MSPFDAAIRILDDKDEYRGDYTDPLNIKAAIRVLEAAGKLTETDKSWLLSKVDWAIAEYVPAIEGMVCPGAAMKDRFRALLAALPDKETP